MSRLNVEVDDAMIEKIMRIYRFKTKREAIEFSLKRTAGASDPRGFLRLVGTGWEGDLDEMRRGRFPAWDIDEEKP